MQNKREISIVNIAGTVHCSASDDGDKVYEAIVTSFEKKEAVELSFKGVEDLTTAFLNAAVGRLYDGRFDYEFITKHLRPVNTSNDDLYYLKRVVERAKEFFANSERFTSADTEVFGDD